MRVHNIVNYIHSTRPNHQLIQIVKQNDPLEPLFFTYLVEDKAFETMSYVDFLCHVHKQIQAQL